MLSPYRAISGDMIPTPIWAAKTTANRAIKVFLFTLLSLTEKPTAFDRLSFWGGSGFYRLFGAECIKVMILFLPQYFTTLGISANQCVWFRTDENFIVNKYW